LGVAGSCLPCTTSGSATASAASGARPRRGRATAPSSTCWPRSRAGRDGAANLLPACRACNRARRSQAVAAYARQRARDGRAIDVELLLRGLDRLAADGTAAERRYGAKQARMVRDWRDGEAALAARVARATRA
jgi:hypothetical protein